MGEAETTPDHNIVAGTPPLAGKKRSGLMTTPEKESLEVVSSIPAINFIIIPPDHAG